MHFEEVPYPGSDNTTSDIFYKTRPKQSSRNPSSNEWRNKLNLEPYPLMDNRKVEIKEIQLVNDGYLSSHKEYKIRSYTTEGADEKEISRRYSDFEWLVSQLTTKYPGCIVPPLPEKNPLTNINQEKVSFLESRKRGLLLFLEKMLQHPDLRYASDFISFLMCNDIEFNNIVEKSKKPGVIAPIITSLLEQIPAVTSGSFFSNIINKFSEGEKIRREKSENDIKIEHHESYINFLENSVSELTKYAGQMASVERDQANMLLDLSNNLNEIGKFDKNNKLEICKKMSLNTESCSEVQKEHAKYFNDELETKLKEVNSFIISAQDAIKRRNGLKDIIEKNSTQISELERQRNNKYLDLLRVNEENKVRLEEVDEILLDEIQAFEPEIVTKIDEVARDFMAHQTRYAKEMYNNWTAEESQ